jgi:hypothetical protein
MTIEVKFAPNSKVWVLQEGKAKTALVTKVSASLETKPNKKGPETTVEYHLKVDGITNNTVLQLAESRVFASKEDLLASI